jgi:ABC-type phosphate transport system substrate-binding protein
LQCSYINEIKYWDDERLQQINPDIKDALPHVPIRIAYQSGSSAITYHYTNLLSKANATFNSIIGPGQTIKFPVLQQEVRVMTPPPRLHLTRAHIVVWCSPTARCP